MKFEPMIFRHVMYNEQSSQSHDVNIKKMHYFISKYIHY